MENKPQNVILAVGAHTGDAQLTSGMLLARHAQQGDKIIMLDLTAGERGAPKGVSIADFRKRNVEGAAKFADLLGGTSIVFDIPDGELYANQALELQVAQVMREHRVTQVLYHWQHSLHKDHLAAHTITKNAIFFAALPTYEHPLPPARITRTMMAENWEDSEGFVPYFYVDVSDAFALWKKAIVNLWLAENSTSFQYLRYYEALSICRGAMIGKQHASAFATFDYAKRQVLET